MSIIDNIRIKQDFDPEGENGGYKCDRDAKEPYKYFMTVKIGGPVFSDSAAKQARNRTVPGPFDPKTYGHQPPVVVDPGDTPKTFADLVKEGLSAQPGERRLVELPLNKNPCGEIHLKGGDAKVTLFRDVDGNPVDFPRADPASFSKEEIRRHVKPSALLAIGTVNYSGNNPRHYMRFQVEGMSFERFLDDDGRVPGVFFFGSHWYSVTIPDGGYNVLNNTDEAVQISYDGTVMVIAPRGQVRNLRWVNPLLKMVPVETPWTEAEHAADMDLSAVEQRIVAYCKGDVNTEVALNEAWDKLEMAGLEEGDIDRDIEPDPVDARNYEEIQAALPEPGPVTCIKPEVRADMLELPQRIMMGMAFSKTGRFRWKGWDDSALETLNDVKVIECPPLVDESRQAGKIQTLAYQYGMAIGQQFVRGEDEAD